MKKIVLLRHDSGPDDDRIVSYLRKLGIEPEILRPFAGETPGEVDDSVAASVVYGGPFNVYEENRHPFLHDENRWIEACLEREIPLLGICQGAQSIAHVLGAYAGPVDDGRCEFGYYEVRPTEAGRDWFAVHTPGHTEDHLCLFDPEHGVMLSGDHVLPTITPHISGYAENDPLARFFASLERMKEFEGVTVALPAHGHPFEDLAGRAHDILVHHEERLDLIRHAVDDMGEGTVTEYMQRLFRERSWGSMAESETFAHLEHLRVLGEVTARADAGPTVFRAA